MNANSTFKEWIVYLENLHPKSIDLGVERVNQVCHRMGLLPSFPIIVVGGTNGKGSVCAMVSTILKCTGYKVGTYTSPHVLHYHERITINLEPITDESMIEHFAAIEIARQHTTLTCFEFLTLAAMRHFIAQGVDVAVLEVGLGGRLDAVNVFDADVAIVTNIDLDHCDWLGHTREAIGYEKAGIFRTKRPAVVGDINPPESLCHYARSIGAHLRLTGQDFYAKGEPDDWSFYSDQLVCHALSLHHLRATYQVHNASLALAGLMSISSRLPVSKKAIQAGLIEARWPWRFQRLNTKPAVILDVAHNPHGVAALVNELNKLPSVNKQLAVFSMLSDKDIDASLALARQSFDAWYIAGLDVPRGLSSDALSLYFKRQEIVHIHVFDTISDAWDAALWDANACDRIVVFGSFHTIAAVEEVRLSNKGLSCQN